MIPHYRTKIEQRKILDKTFVLETLFDLDEAIEQLCDSLGDHPDPFAEDKCPYYGVLWPAAEGLVQLLLKNIERLKDKKIVEVGCGLAFPSLVASSLKVDVLATDFHPGVPQFLERNLRHNSLSLNYQRFNWRDTIDTIGTFDIVMGSDVLYEPRHPSDVAMGFKRLLNPGGEVWLSDPGRGYLQKFVDQMKELGFKYDFEPQKVSTYEMYNFRFY
jgi:predicted nicotinamide N-methyase